MSETPKMPIFLIGVTNQSDLKISNVANEANDTEDLEKLQY